MSQVIPEKIPRPDSLPSKSTKVKLGCGSLYIHVTFYNGKPFEVFASLGKDLKIIDEDPYNPHDKLSEEMNSKQIALFGGCMNTNMEALCRSISLGLRYGLPPEDYIKQLIGIQCPKPMKYGKGAKGLSCSDAIANILRSHLPKKEEDSHV